MAAHNINKMFGETFGVNLTDLVRFPLDPSSFLEIQRKNIQAVSEAQKLAFEGFQTLASRQGDFFAKAVEETSELMREILNEGTPEEKAIRSTEILRNNYESSLKNWNEMSGVAEQCSREAADVISDRVSASLTELKTALIQKRGESKKSVSKKAA